VVRSHPHTQRFKPVGWWLGVVVTHFIRSAKLLYAGLG